MACLPLFTLMGMIVIVNSSIYDARPNMETKFCQFGVYVAHSKGECLQKCQPSSGFIHPISKTLTCFNVQLPAVPFLGFLNSSSPISCQCGILWKSHNFVCKPERIYGKDELDECSRVCPQITGYMFAQKNSTELLYCAKSAQMEILQLGLLVSRVNRINAETNKTHRVYECKCGVGWNGMQLTYPKRKKTRKQVVKNIEDIDLVCPETIPFTASSLCLKRCNKLKGYIPRSSEQLQLVCFHKMITAAVISKGTNPCACGHETIDGTRDNCNPELVFDKIHNYRECKLKCFNYTILRRKNVNKVYENVWCEENLNETEIIEDIKWSKEEIYNEERDAVTYNCVCGATLSHANPDEKDKKRKSRKESISHETIREIYHISRQPNVPTSNSGSDEFEATCSLGKFEMSNIQACHTACQKAKGYFVKTNTGNQLICYHYTKVGQRIPSYINTRYSTVVANGTCECGIIFNQKNKDIKYIETCIPEVKYEMKAKSDGHKLPLEKKRCDKTCQEQTAFVFEIYRKRVLVRCESDKILTQIYQKLDCKGDVIKIDEETKEKKVQCECGLTSLSLRIFNQLNDDILTISHSEDKSSRKYNNSEKVASDISQKGDNIILDERDAAVSNNEINISNGIKEDESLETLPDDVLSFLEGIEEYSYHEMPSGMENDIPVENSNIPTSNNQDEVESNAIQTNALNTNEGDETSPHKKQFTKDGDNTRSHYNNFGEFILGDELSCLLANQSHTMTIDDLITPQFPEQNEHVTLPIGDYEIPSILENTLQSRNKRRRY